MLERKSVIWSALLAIGAALAPAGPAQWAGLSPYGVGGCGSGFEPTLHTGGEAPVLGAAAFALISENLTGGTPGVFFFSARQRSLAVIGLTLYIDPLLGVGAACVASGAPGVAGAGAARLALGIPNDPTLTGGTLYIQGFFYDASLPFTFVHTRGLAVTPVATVVPAAAVVRELRLYENFFAGAAPSQADALGRTIWAANQVAGFGYLKTERFGQGPWMIVVQHVQTGMEFCLVPGGVFRMGDIRSTGYQSEVPVHWARIEPFLVARTEVTQARFTQAMAASPWVGQPYAMTGTDYAASYIHWADAGAFCAKAGLRLPSEAEWEYACRAGAQSCYSFGEDFPAASLPANAWFEQNAALANQAYPHQVAQKPPNAFGLLDMHGNVWEWCSDAVATSLLCAPSDGRPAGGASSQRARRGGGWNSPARYCRSPYRDWFPADLRFADMGFRPVRSLQ